MGLIKTAMYSGAGIYAVNKLAKANESHQAYKYGAQQQQPQQAPQQASGPSNDPGFQQWQAQQYAQYQQWQQGQNSQGHNRGYSENQNGYSPQRMIDQAPDSMDNRDTKQEYYQRQ